MPGRYIAVGFYSGVAVKRGSIDLLVMDSSRHSYHELERKQERLARRRSERDR